MIKFYEVKEHKFLADEYINLFDVLQYEKISENDVDQLLIEVKKSNFVYKSEKSLVEMLENKQVLSLFDSGEIFKRGMGDLSLVNCIDNNLGKLTLVFERAEA